MYGNVLDTILLIIVMIGVFLTVALETLLLSENGKITNWEKAVLILVVVLIILTIILWQKQLYPTYDQSYG